MEQGAFVWSVSWWKCIEQKTCGQVTSVICVRRRTMHPIDSIYVKSTKNRMAFFLQDRIKQF